LNDYEKTFVLKTTRLRSSGVDFQGLAREALTGKFGGAADVLLRDLSSRGLTDPVYFVQEISRIFGRGSMGILEPITRYVEMGLYTTNQSSSIESLLGQFGPAPDSPPGDNTVLLHQHRVEDEEGNYSDGEAG
jgi:hypothetical protein